jgi:integrase
MSEQAPFTVLLRLAEENKLTSDDFSRDLTAAKVRTAKGAAVPLTLADGGGLSLYVPPTGAKVWRYRFRLAGKQQILTIGSYPDLSLEQARFAHRAARWLVSRGIQPLHHVEAEIEQQRIMQRKEKLSLLGSVAQVWLEATDINLSPRTVKHRKAMLDKYIFPQLGNRAIHEITRKELWDLLTQIDKETPVTARHCHGYIKRMFEWAVDAELVGSNPTPRIKVLTNAVSRSVTPRKALSLKRIGDFLLSLEDAPETSFLTKSALKLLILTWCRTSEVVGAKWSEFDTAAGIWTIPSERMKAGEQHRVFLSTQAINLLKTLERTATGEFLFPNRRHLGKPMNRMTLTNWRKRWGFANEMDIHGFRALASTWANESGRHRSDVIEVALAHKETDRVRAAYNRAQFIKDLRILWQDWANLCDETLKHARAAKIETQNSKVVTLLVAA